jgi:hypothetical protein
VFLQSLDNLKSTMFLTTYGVEKADPAFESCINLTLSYPELAVESRCKLWTDSITSLQLEKASIIPDVVEKLAGVDLEWKPDQERRSNCGTASRS